MFLEIYTRKCRFSCNAESVRNDERRKGGARNCFVGNVRLRRDSSIK